MAQKFSGILQGSSLTYETSFHVFQSRQKKKVCMRIKFNSQKICQGDNHGRDFFVLGHIYGRRDVM